MINYTKMATIPIRSSIMNHTSMNGAVTLVQLATVAYELQAINILRGAKFIFVFRPSGITHLLITFHNTIHYIKFLFMTNFFLSYAPKSSS